MIVIIVLLLALFLAPFGSTISESSGSMTLSPESSTATRTIADGLDSVLKNAATATESYLVSEAASGYQDATLRALRKEGLQIPDHIEVKLAITTSDRYCIEARASGEVAHYDSNHGAPEPGAC